MKKVILGEILTESKVESINPNPSKRITVRLNLKGVKQRPLKNDTKGATKYYTRRHNQLIYGKQNLFKGAFGIIPKGLDGYETSSDLPCFDVDATKCVPEWILYFLIKEDFYKTLEKIARGAGSKRISPKDFSQIIIPLPSLNTQKNVLSKLILWKAKSSNLNSEVNNQQILLKKLKQSILQEAIEGKLTQDWRTKNPDIEPASVLLEKIKAEKTQLIKDKKIKQQKPLLPIKSDEIPFDIPDSWVWCRLGGITNIVRGGSPRPAGDQRFYNGKIPFLKVADLTKNEDMYVSGYTYSIKEAGLYKTRYIKDETLMLTNSGATLGVPKICNFPTTFNDGIAAFIYMNYELYKPYFYFLLKSKTKWFLYEASRGQGQPNLNTNIIGDIIIPLPPLAEQKQIVKKIESLFKICDALETQINQSKTNSQNITQAVLKEAFAQNDRKSYEPGSRKSYEPGSYKK